MELTPQSTPSTKQIFVQDLKARDKVRTSFLVKSKDLLVSKKGDPYLALILGDRTGVIETRIWDSAEMIGHTFQEGDVVAVAGKTNLFQNRLQLVVEHIVPVPTNEIAMDDYVPQTEANLNLLYDDLIGEFEKLKNPWVRDLGLALLRDPEIAARYKVCPAAKTIHHAFIGGLLTHSLQLIHLVKAILPLYQDIDADILIFGAAFHDFGKIFELSYAGNFGYTDEGKLVGHIAIGVTLIDRKIRELAGFPESLEWQLKHLILSHHGKLEHGSPKRPHTIEALILHHLDDMDSKINSVQTFMQADRSQSRWTGHHKAYDQYYYRPDAYIEDSPGNE
jgi:3'-5' exoribonuclease